jgi:Zn-dependent protease
MGSIILPVVFWSWWHRIARCSGLSTAAVAFGALGQRVARRPGDEHPSLLLLSLLSLPAVRGSDYAPGWPFALLQASAVVLNLLPLPGFDGYGALWPYLPREIRALFDRYANYAMLALFLLLFLVPPVARAFWGLVALLTHAAGIPLGLAQVGYGEFKFWD